MGRFKHCREEQCNLIKKLTGEGKTYEEVAENLRMLSKNLKCFKMTTKTRNMLKKMSNYC